MLTLTPRFWCDLLSLRLLCLSSSGSWLHKLRRARSHEELEGNSPKWCVKERCCFCRRRLTHGLRSADISSYSHMI